MPGFFIVFEGPDGAGTTKHSTLLAEKLRERGKEVVLTMEPTKGMHGMRIRKMLHEGGATTDTLQTLFAADRADHIERVLAPGIQEEKIVISDRYIPSTLVYGQAQGLPFLQLHNLNKNFIQPDLMFLLLPPFAVAWQRVEKRKVRDTFEQREFQYRVYEGYRTYAKEHPEVIVIDTSGTKKESAEKIWEKLSERLP